jgi:hypothetical protein
MVAAAVAVAAVTKLDFAHIEARFFRASIFCARARRSSLLLVATYLVDLRKARVGIVADDERESLFHLCLALPIGFPSCS